RPHCARRSFPTRRSSDLLADGVRFGRRTLHPERLQALGRVPLDGLVGIGELEHPAGNGKWLLRGSPDGVNGNMSVIQFAYADERSEEHTSELQSRENLVC